MAILYAAYSLYAIISFSQLYKYLCYCRTVHQTSSGANLLRKSPFVAEIENSLSSITSNSNLLNITSLDHGPEATILSCSWNSIEIVGNIPILPNTIISHVGNGLSLCSECEPLLRKVVSVTPGRMEGSQILATTFATYSDVIEEERIIDKSIASDPIEPSFACEHSSQRSMLKRTEDKDVNNEKAKPRSLQTFPDQCASFAQVDNGQCLYTDCFVGGDSGLNYDCFFKGQDTDNGCGNDLIAQLGVTDFEFYSFARPCCIHDFCYSSITFDQTTCDIEFYSDMIEECNELSQRCSSVCDGKSGLELISCNTLCTSVVAACEVNALAYYGIVNLGGEDAYNSAKSNTKVNQENAVCNNYPPIALCKSTLIIFAGPDGKASIVPQDVDDGSNSNLPDPLVYSFVSPEDEDDERLYFKCDESLGEREITLRVSNSGGSSSCTSIVTLVDNTAPVLVNCPVDLVRDLNMAVTTGPDRATCDQEASWIPPEVEENCSGATLTSTHDPGETFQVGVTEVVYTAKDSSDNESTCSFEVEVFDSTVPIITSKPLIVAPRNPNHKFDKFH